MQIYLTLCKKDYFTLNLITSCSTLGNKDFDEAFVITGNKSVT